VERNQVDESQRGWVMVGDAGRSFAQKAGLLLVVALMAAGCSQNPALEESPSAPASATAAESPSAAATTASPDATGDPQKLTSPEAAAKHLFVSWQTGNKTAALKFADQAAVDEVFSRPYTGPDPEFMGCDHEVDHYFCRYRYEGGSTTYRVDGGNSAGYVVTEVTQTAD
jgi:hypothetical protein